MKGLEGGSTWGLLDPSWVHKDPLELFVWGKKNHLFGAIKRASPLRGMMCMSPLLYWIDLGFIVAGSSCARCCSPGAACSEPCSSEVFPSCFFSASSLEGREEPQKRCLGPVRG